MTAHGRACSSFVLALLMSILILPSRGVAPEPAQDPRPAYLTLTDIVERLNKNNSERIKLLEHFEGRRIYQIDYRGLPTDTHAEMTVDVSYDAPDRVAFTIVSQRGPSWMINRILKKLLETEQESLKNQYRDSVQITSDNYDFALLESPDTSDSCSFVLSAQPRIVNKFLFRGKIWVDSKDFAVCRIEAEPAKNPSFWIKKTEIHFSFLKVGDFWLPAENKSISSVRLNGRAVLTIQYKDYKIQTATALSSTVIR